MMEPGHCSPLTNNKKNLTNKLTTVVECTFAHVLYLGSIFFKYLYFTLVFSFHAAFILLHYVSEGNVVLFTALHLVDK